MGPQSLLGVRRRSSATPVVLDIVWDAQTHLSEILAPAEAPAESCTGISILHAMSRVNSESTCMQPAGRQSRSH